MTSKTNSNNAGNGTVKPNKPKRRPSGFVPRFRDHTAEEIRQAHGNMTDRGTYYEGKCPGCGGRNSFKVHKITNRFWCFVCNPSCKTEAGKLAFKEILDPLGLLGMPYDQPALQPQPASQAAPSARDGTSVKDGQKSAQGYWKYCIDMDGTMVMDYLLRRCIDVHSFSIRFRADALHGDLPGKYPCMVAKFTNTLTGEFQAVQNTFLTVSDEHRRRNIGALAGAGVCVNVQPENEIWVVAEGVEDALALMNAGVEGAIWATGGVGNMENFQVPDHVRHLVIACDMDKPGRKAADKLAKRVHCPPKIEVVIRPSYSGCKDPNESLIKGHGHDFKRRFRSKEAERLSPSANHN